MKKAKMTTKDKAKNNRLMKLYRITLAERDKIRAYQAGHPQFKLLLGGKAEGTDHNHKTGLIRGILNWRINRAYGILENACRENLSEVLRALALFHDEPPATTVLGEKRYGLLGKAMYKKVMRYGG
jgi:hypothetical protein